MNLGSHPDKEGNIILDELPNLVAGVHASLLIGRYPTIPLPTLWTGGRFARCVGRFDDPIPKNWWEMETALKNQQLPANIRRVTERVVRANMPLPHQLTHLQNQMGITDIICLVQNPRSDVDRIAPVIYENAWEQLQKTGIRVHYFPIFARPLMEDEQVIDDIIFVYDNILKQGGNVLVHCLKGATRTGMAIEFILAYEELKKRWRLSLMYKLQAMTRFVFLSRSPAEIVAIRKTNGKKKWELIPNVPPFMQIPRTKTINFRVLTWVLPRLEKILNQNTPSEGTRWIAGHLFSR